MALRLMIGTNGVLTACEDFFINFEPINTDDKIHLPFAEVQQLSVRIILESYVHEHVDSVRFSTEIARI